MPLPRSKLAIREFDISEFESHMPSHGVGLCGAICCGNRRRTSRRTRWLRDECAANAGAAQKIGGKAIVSDANPNAPAVKREAEEDRGFEACWLECLVRRPQAVTARKREDIAHPSNRPTARQAETYALAPCPHAARACAGDRTPSARASLPCRLP